MLAFIFLFIGYNLFSPIYSSNNIIITYGIHPFNICNKNPELWQIIKYIFIFTYIFSSIIISNFIYLSIFNIFSNLLKKVHSFKFPKLINQNNLIDIKRNNNLIELYIGENKSLNKSIYLPEKSLYQNILITGTIGTGKTSSAMYPFTEQFIANKLKLPMLILDVKGNYYLKVKELCKKYNRLNDLIVIELNGIYTYNPLHKPNLKASVIADRLKEILLLFSPNNSESYWIDKAHQVLTEAIKLCRIYNNGYVTFEEIHKLITNQYYYQEKIPILKDLFIKNKLSKEDIYNLYASLNFFEKELFSLDSRTISILKSEITRITNCFISDYNVYNTFCPSISRP